MHIPLFGIPESMLLWEWVNSSTSVFWTFVLRNQRFDLGRLPPCKSSNLRLNVTLFWLKGQTPHSHTSSFNNQNIFASWIRESNGLGFLTLPTHVILEEWQHSMTWETPLDRKNNGPNVQQLQSCVPAGVIASNTVIEWLEKLFGYDPGTNSCGAWTAWANFQSSPEHHCNGVKC